MVESRAEPYVSIVIPVYNEEAILHAAIVFRRRKLQPLVRLFIAIRVKG